MSGYSLMEKENHTILRFSTIKKRARINREYPSLTLRVGYYQKRPNSSVAPLKTRLNGFSKMG